MRVCTLRVALGILVATEYHADIVLAGSDGRCPVGDLFHAAVIPGLILARAYCTYIFL